MRTKEQIRIANRQAAIRRRSKPPTMPCACSRPATHWTSCYEPECDTCRRLASAQVKFEILGAPEQRFLPADKLVKYVPLYERFCVSIREFADSMLIHAHGDYILKIQ